MRPALMGIKCMQAPCATHPNVFLVSVIVLAFINGMVNLLTTIAHAHQHACIHESWSFKGTVCLFVLMPVYPLLHCSLVCSAACCQCPAPMHLNPIPHLVPCQPCTNQDPFPNQQQKEQYASALSGLQLLARHQLDMVVVALDGWRQSAEEGLSARAGALLPFKRVSAQGCGGGRHILVSTLTT